ncbi:hypothetical protein DFJ68_2809 [Terracoccus luteus]|uniref:Sugar phosphate isomerase n=1 Tax=Terracoccus luteus TaxID=53356 RepID=A0A495XZH5_9MICO|nr:EboA domain-containing protein [Terracoccus luteus]RKT79342.1 hypothetical protein DFJ68_2809 [Terracoccus luteus]
MTTRPTETGDTSPARAGRQPADVAAAVAQVASDPSRIDVLFPAARRLAVREGLDPDEARAGLLLALPSDAVADAVARVYHQGDPAEKYAVLAALPRLDDAEREARIGDAALPLVRDALRTNDTRLVAAAMGPYAERHLDDAAWRQAVLKLVFMGVPVSVVSGLERRADDELARMASDFADERRAAGRVVPTDVDLLLGPGRPASDTTS